MANYDVELNTQINIPGTENDFNFNFWHPTLVRPARKRLFCLKAKNGLGRFAPSALPHYKGMEIGKGVSLLLYSTRQLLINSYFSSVSRFIFPPISADMLNSIFLLGEEVQNARFLKFMFLFCKGVQCNLFFLSGCQDCFFSWWHPSLMTHKIFIRNDALQDYRHHSSSWPPSMILL